MISDDRGSHSQTLSRSSLKTRLGWVRLLILFVHNRGNQVYKFLNGFIRYIDWCMVFLLAGLGLVNLFYSWTMPWMHNPFHSEGDHHRMSESPTMP
jgi:hypothetical protein